jgi:hypothetical protein
LLKGYRRGGGKGIMVSLKKEEGGRMRMQREEEGD